MKILVTGGRGMAGHIIVDYLSRKPDVDVYCTIREKSVGSKIIKLDLIDQKRIYSVLKRVQPDVVINAAGILNDDAAKRLKESIYINSLLPQLLAEYGDRFGFKLIHISTDCVFSGSKGKYSEDDPADGSTIYAKTKSLGEVTDKRHVTIRTSIIGPEIREQGIGLFHWFMKQTGTIEGYEQVFWNGVTTLELSKAIDWILKNDIGGLVHLAAEKEISKYSLLQLIKDEFNKEHVQIIPNSSKTSDKTLINTRADFTYNVPSYKTMLREMKQWMVENHDIYSSYLADGGV